MSRDQMLSTEVLSSTSQLTQWYRSGCKEPGKERVGTEHEKFLVRKSDLSPLPYEGPDGIGQVFAKLAESGDFEVSTDEGHIVALVEKAGPHAGASLTIEPGGQFELSGAPYLSMHDTEAELADHTARLKPVLDELGVLMVGAGLNGVNTLDEVPWMPKSRYRIMAPYMERRGKLGRWMMKMTSTIQANFDYTSEADAADILHTALRISPVVSAIFARSPLQAGKPTGFLSTRCHIWTDTDPDRCGFPEFMLRDKDFGFVDWARWTLKVPMYFVRRDHKYVDFTQQRTTFRQFMEQGFNGIEATLGDYELHVSTLFPEVRMKQYIEVRGADMGPAANIVALPALWKGILYDSGSRKAARELLAHLSIAAHGRLFEDMIRRGVSAIDPTNKTPVHSYALELLRLARQGLDRQVNTGLARPGEGRFLDPIEDSLTGADGHPSDAHRLLARFDELDGDAMAWFAEQTL